jgi:hypothetical protein
MRTAVLVFSALLCWSCTHSSANGDVAAGKRVAALDCSSEQPQARLRIGGTLGGRLSTANLVLGAQRFTTDTSGQRVMVGPSLMTEEFLRVDLLKPTGSLFARLEAKLAGQVQGWPVDGPLPVAPPLTGWITYNNESHPLLCRFTEPRRQALLRSPA